MDRRRSQLLAVGVLLLVTAYGLPLPDEPVGDEATHLLATASLWHDRDLRFDERDLARGYRLWPGGPRGLSLLPDEDGERHVFATPVVYPFFAAPFYGVLGPRGLRVVHMALYLVMLWLAARRLVTVPHPPPERAPGVGRPATARTRRPPLRVGLLLGGVFFATGGVVWVLRFQPEVLLMTCSFVAVALWCLVRAEPIWGGRELLPFAFAGFLLAGPAVTDPALGLLALPIAIDLVWGRRFRSAAVFALVFLAVATATAAIQHRVAGEWGAGVMAEATVYAEAPYPYEAGAGAAADPAAGAAHDEEVSASLSARRVAWLLAGRHVGLLPYFPFLFYLAALYFVDLSQMKGRRRHLLALALLAYFVLVVAGFPGSAVPGAAGAAAPGARAMALVYPLFLFLPLRLRAGRGVLLPLVAAGLWALPAVAVAAGGAAPRYGLELAARGPAYRVLPMELELLADGALPGYGRFGRFGDAQGGLWWVPLESFFLHEPNPDGVWVRGSSRSEVFVVAGQPIEELRFRVRSLADRNELLLEGAADRTRVRFDTEGKRSGTPVTVRPELLAHGLGLFAGVPPEEERIYRFTIETTGGAVPQRLDPKSRDPRYLGVFLELSTGE